MLLLPRTLPCSVEVSACAQGQRGQAPRPGACKWGPTQLPPDQALEVWGAEFPLLTVLPSPLSALFHLSASFWGCWLWGRLVHLPLSTLVTSWGC